ncbi:MAG: fructosamine kinase family protein [Gammaproteobacteria bacterium]|nr:fructosamine kinase family protein [Gammaproteobacteria bacterium]
MSSTEFRKQGPLTALSMFEAEAEGLAELKKAGAIRVPEVYDVGTDADGAYIAMERLELERGRDRDAATLGEELAALHRHTADLHGWHRDNTIGSTPQHNSQTNDWVAFFRGHRLQFQLDLAARNGYLGELQDRGKQLAEHLGELFEGYDPAPSLLHGDLWAGNWGVTDGVPVIFDPAVYFGDRETDIAMTQLFGGFGGAFYRAYERAWPLSAGSAKRLELYKLYHVLNHLNLFGSAYLNQALSILRQLTR